MKFNFKIPKEQYKAVAEIFECENKNIQKDVFIDQLKGNQNIHAT